MSERAKRLIAECRQIATMTEEPGRITRRFLTAPVRVVHAHLRRRMEALQMGVHIDSIGNFRGVWEPANASERRLILGSHIDTVPNAGAFDGVLGVIVALEWVAIAQQLASPFAIEVIAFSEEEGARFGVPFLGSRTVAGRFDPALLQLKDSDGISVEDAIRTFGLDPDDIALAAINQESLGFIEVHIEQGPLLEAEDLSLGVVTGIVGQTRLSLEFSGQANHAGTTPMHLRKDALAGAAEWITAVESHARKTEGLVATVGKIAVDPDAVNVIPASARISLDLRHTHDTQRFAAVDELIATAERVAVRRGLTFRFAPKINEPAVPMDERLSSYLSDAMQLAGLPAHALPSGAGHDAMVLAARMPTAMLFLRSPGGISHHPDETVREQDVEAALRVGEIFLERLGSEVRSSEIR
jgi:allantoate deiminase